MTASNSIAKTLRDLARNDAVTNKTALAAADALEAMQRERDEAEALAQSLQNKWASRPLSHPDGEELALENNRLRDELEQIKTYAGLRRDGTHPDANPLVYIEAVASRALSRQEPK